MLIYFLGSMRGFACCVEGSLCAGLSSSPSSYLFWYWQGNCRSLHFFWFIFHVFNLSRDFDLEYQNLFSRRAWMYSVSLNEGLWLWWMAAFLATHNWFICQPGDTKWMEILRKRDGANRQAPILSLLGMPDKQNFVKMHNTCIVISCITYSCSAK